MKIGRTTIKGLDNLPDADLILGFMKQVKKNTNLNFPNLLEFRKLKRSYGRASFRHNYTKIFISEELTFDSMLFVVLHELVHISGQFHHKKSFWRKFFNNCSKMNLKISEKYIHYKSGKNYFKKLNERVLV